MAPPLLEVEGLAYAYAGAVAVRDVAFAVGEGEVVALVGANGAGKSTSVKCVAGALRPARGRIRFAGDDVAGLPVHEVVARGITLVPEGRLVFPQMTIEDNLLVGGWTPRARDERGRRLDEVFAIFARLAERRHQLAGSLSGGEQQMLAIARGLMSGPRLIILDEPSLGLMPKLVRELFRLIASLRERGVSILLVEQNVHQSLKIADRAYVLEKGSIALSGPGAELADNPYVREAFLGLAEA
ncbi:MAG: ABC transporter ATP-binding protein [Alphaproteobacteria bacterium]|nr:ABC transporter ATP-binding protein [Alphaproteobacteria bacterium]